MSEQSSYRTPYESPLPIRQIKMYMARAKTPAERAVYRDMIRGPEYNKFKDGTKSSPRKKRAKVEAPTDKKKK